MMSTVGREVQRLSCTASTRVLGVDFDHTLCDYSAVLPNLLERFGFGRLVEALPRNADKKAIRNALRGEPDGEQKWQEIQAELYGTALANATPYLDARRVLTRLEASGSKIVLISHKTRFARRGDPKNPVDLRQAALDWLSKHGFLAILTRENVHFANHLDEKVDLVSALGCSAFVDDLPSVLCHPRFPHQAEPILFVPNGFESLGPRYGQGSPDEAPPRSISLLARWDRLQPRQSPTTQSKGQGPLVGDLEHCIGQQLVRATPLAGGANSAVHRLDDPAGKRFVAKRFALRPEHQRDAMVVEANALRFLHEVGIKNTPRLLGAANEQRTLILSHLEGSQNALPRSSSDINALLRVLEELDTAGECETASHFGAAADASFSLAQLKSSLNTRLRRLRSAPTTSETDRLKAVLNTIETQLSHHAEIATKSLKTVGISPSTKLSREHRRLSPSDFGFHNALRDNSGAWHFLDFEFFGWDDPAKTIIDVTLHPRMTLSREQVSQFVEQRLAALAQDETLPARVNAYYPLLALKWCTIFLNEFLPTEDVRRRLAGQTTSLAARQNRQLTLVENRLKLLEKQRSASPRSLIHICTHAIHSHT